MALEGESRRRPLALALSAVAPVLLVALWLGFSGSDDPQTPGTTPRESAGLAEMQRGASNPAAAPSESRTRKTPSGDGLASLAERQRALTRQREAARRGTDVAGSPEEEYSLDESEWDADPEWEEDGIVEQSTTSGEPSPEEIEELLRLTRAGTPPPEVLRALMEDEPPMPSPEEIAHLRQRTAELLDFDKDLIEQVRAESASRQPTPERLEELQRRLDAERQQRAARAAQAALGN